MNLKTFSKYYLKNQKERLEILKQEINLTPEDLTILKSTGALSFDTANRMIENVVGTMQLPLSVVTNFVINKKEYLIPMSVEEPSIVAAASNVARIIKKSGGFETTSDEPIMIGQIQIVDIPDPQKAILEIKKFETALFKKANEQDKVLTDLGGGLKKIEYRVIDTEVGEMLIVHLNVDVRDAMGANAVNNMAEALGPILQEITGGTVVCKILSNLAVSRKASARAVLKAKDLEEALKGYMKGDEIVKRFMQAYYFAKNDPYRATTHNKGILNGIDAVLVATGNDFRAVEAGAHSYAAITGRYTSLSKFSVNQSGDIVAELELPMAVGIVGGSIKTHPVTKLALKILDVKSAREFSEILVSVGLAQNISALFALSTVGIQLGHMRLHAKNIAVLAGAENGEIDQVAAKMVTDNCVRVDNAQSIILALRSKKSS